MAMARPRRLVALARIEPADPFGLAILRQDRVDSLLSTTLGNSIKEFFITPSRS